MVDVWGIADTARGSLGILERSEGSFVVTWSQITSFFSGKNLGVKKQFKSDVQEEPSIVSYSKVIHKKNQV